jgi:hypothetical protein
MCAARNAVVDRLSRRRNAVVRGKRGERERERHEIRESCDQHRNLLRRRTKQAAHGYSSRRTGIVPKV